MCTHSGQRHPDCRASGLRSAAGACAAPRPRMRARRPGRDGLAGAQGIQRGGGRRVRARWLQPDAAAAAAAAHARRRLRRAAARVQAQRRALLRVPGATRAATLGAPRVACSPIVTPQVRTLWRRRSSGPHNQRTLMDLVCHNAQVSDPREGSPAWPFQPCKQVHASLDAAYQPHADMWTRLNSTHTDEQFPKRTIKEQRAALCVCAHVRVRSRQARHEQAQEAQRPRQPCHTSLPAWSGRALVL